jgi:uncharacterized protein (DUF488 family)
MNTTENNKLIAVFDDREVHTDGIGWFDEKFKVFTYHKDYNEIMRVVKKLIDLDNNEELLEKLSSTDSKQLLVMGSKERAVTNSLVRSYTTIDTTYKAVVEYIKWYNENK